MSWGYRIATLYISFVIMIIALVIMSMKQKVDLVTPDYYKQELQFQDKLDKINRADQLKHPLMWNVNNDRVRFSFPEDQNNIAGTIYFYRPSDVKQDHVYSIQLKKVEQEINTENFLPGIYKIEVDWKNNDTSYFKEGIINIK
jgi:hypothetical protein